MKKLVCVVALVAVICLSVTVGLSEYYKVVTNDGDGLNVRDSKRNGSVLGVLSEGKVVDVIDTDGAWGTIEYNGQTAYVYLKYLQRTNEPVSPARKSQSESKDEKDYSDEDTTLYRVKLNVKSFVNVRRKPKLEGSLGKLYRGEEVNVLKIKGDWAYIVWNGKLRYIPAKYLEEVTEDIELLETEYGWYIVNPKEGRLNVYKGPGVDYAIRKSLKRGTRVFVEEDLGAWVGIHDENGNSIGYVMSLYLKPLDE